MMNNNHNNKAPGDSAKKTHQVSRCAASNLRAWKRISQKPSPDYWYLSSYPVASAAAPGTRSARKTKQQQRQVPVESPEAHVSSGTQPQENNSALATQHASHVGQTGSLKAVLLLGGLRELFGGMHDDLGTVLQSGGISDEMIDQLKDVSTAIGLVVEELNNCRAPCCELHGDSGEKCSCK